MQKQSKEIEKYGGYSITYNVELSRFECEDEEAGFMHADTLQSLRNRLDKIGQEAKTKQPQQKVLKVFSPYQSTWNIRMDDALVGSFGMYARYHGTAKLYAWITTGKGYSKTRERVEMEDTYNHTKYILDTPKNREQVEKAIAIGKEVEAFIKAKKAEQEKIIDKLETAKPLVAKDTLPNWER